MYVSQKLIDRQDMEQQSQDSEVSANMFPVFGKLHNLTVSITATVSHQIGKLYKSWC